MPVDKVSIISLISVATIAKQDAELQETKPVCSHSTIMEGLMRSVPNRTLIMEHTGVQHLWMRSRMLSMATGRTVVKNVP